MRTCLSFGLLFNMVVATLMAEASLLPDLLQEGRWCCAYCSYRKLDSSITDVSHNKSVIGACSLVGAMVSNTI